MYVAMRMCAMVRVRCALHTHLCVCTFPVSSARGSNTALPPGYGRGAGHWSAGGGKGALGSIQLLGAVLSLSPFCWTWVAFPFFRNSTGKGTRQLRFLPAGFAAQSCH